FAGAGLGEPQKIAARQQRRDGAGLDGGGVGVVLRREGAEDRLGNAKRGKRYVSHLKSLKPEVRARLRTGNGCCRLPRTLEGTEVHKILAMTAKGLCAVASDDAYIAAKSLKVKYILRCSVTLSRFSQSH